MEYLKVREAATRLNVSPSTLRAWEQRFGFPRPGRSPGGHRLYRHADIAALRDALEQGLSISSAISRVRQGDTVDAAALVGPLCAIDPERAAAVVEGALALRSLERTVEQVLLPALAQIHRRHGPDSVEWAFAASWIDEWIRWAQRLALHPKRPIRVLVGDATRGELSLDSVHAHALQLFCTRAGAHLLTLPVRAMKGVARAVALFAPGAIVVAGRHGREAEVERWLQIARAAAGECPVATFHRGGATGSPALPAVAAHPLSPSPLAAHQELLRLASGERAAQVS
jgi:MerR family transcriptional regulator, light-induced transcriptional regulator